MTTATASSDRPTITVTPADLAERRAYVRYGPEARIKLCHMAGAPWSDRDPTAQLHKLQRECLSRPEREKIIHGASRLGKSVLGGCEAIIEAMQPGGKLAVVAGRYDHVAHEWQYLDKGMKRLFRGTGQNAFLRLKFVHRPSQHDYDLETIWGSKARGYSVESDDGAALLGQEFTRMVLGEGSHVPHEIFEKKALRALDGALMEDATGRSREAGYVSVYTTPKGYEGCSAAEWDRIKKQTKNEPRNLWYGLVPFAKSCWVREANILENPAYNREVFEARKATMSKAAFEEQYEGKMTFKTGRVLAEFDEDVHVRIPWEAEAIRGMQLAIGIDTGAYFGAVLCGLRSDDDGIWHRAVLDEVYTEQRTIGESCAEVKEMVVRNLMEAFDLREMELDDAWNRIVDNNVIEVWAVDPASQHKLEIVEEFGGGIALTSPPGVEGGKLELIPSLDILRAWIEAGTVNVSDSCQNLIDQIRRYVWKQTKAAGTKNAPVIVEPRKAYDHLIDALRFALFALQVEGPREAPPPAITVKEAWERAQKERIFGPLRDVLQEAKEWEELHGIVR